MINEEEISHPKDKSSPVCLDVGMTPSCLGGKYLYFEKSHIMQQKAEISAASLITHVQPYPIKERGDKPQTTKT